MNIWWFVVILIVSMALSMALVAVIWGDAFNAARSVVEKLEGENVRRKE